MLTPYFLASRDRKTSEGEFTIKPVYTSPLEQDSGQSSSDCVPSSIATQKQQQTGSKNLGELDRDLDELPVYFGAGRKPPVPKKPNYTNHRSDYDLRSYPNRQITDHLSMSTLPTISSTVDARKNRDDWSQIPIYATVNRNGRRQERNFAAPFPVAHPSYVNGTVRAPSSLQQPEKYNSVSRPHSAQSQDSGFARSQSQLSSPPIIRMDHFPSSESETYSEMSRGVPMPPPPPPPPPLPSAADLNGTLRRLNQAQMVDKLNKEDSRDEPSPRPVSHIITPPKENAFSVLAKMGPIPDRKMILKPRGGLPPPPPPRKSSSGRFNDSNIVNPGLTQNQHCNSQGTESGLHDNHHSEDYEDEDSDNWDFYDDFEFSPGVSHV